MHNIKQLQDRLNITSGTDVFQNDRKVQETAKYRTRTRRTSITAYINTQIHNPSSSEVKRKSEATTKVAAQKTVESHNEIQKVVKARDNPRSTSKTTIPTM